VESTGQAAQALDPATEKVLRAHGVDWPLAQKDPAVHDIEQAEAPVEEKLPFGHKLQVLAPTFAE
jgi:hypothetical protein